MKIERIMELSQLVQKIPGIKVQPHKPPVGRSVFLMTADTHIEGISGARIEKKTKSFIELEEIGQKAFLLFGPSALGGESIKLKGKEMGMNLNEE